MLTTVFPGDHLEQGKSLVHILNTYNLQSSDITTGGTDKHTGHSYTGVYQHLFEPNRIKCFNLLEIGVLYGGSSLLWQKYFPCVNICAVDNNNILKPVNTQRLDPARFEFNLLDAYSQDTINILYDKHPERYSIIIDDAHHTEESQTYVLDHYPKLLTTHGLLVIEDVPGLQPLLRLHERAKKLYPTATVHAYDLNLLRNNADDYILTVQF